MSWEVDYTIELRCADCGRIGRQVKLSNDWNRHDTRFENFSARWIVNNRPSRLAEPGGGGHAVPVCPDCGEKAEVLYGERRNG
jgi:hypothetical protein